MKYGKFLPNPSYSVVDRHRDNVIRSVAVNILRERAAGASDSDIKQSLQRAGYTEQQARAAFKIADAADGKNPGDFVHVRIKSTGREVLSQKFPDERLHPFKQRVADDNGVKVSDVEIIKGSTTIKGNSYLEGLTVAELHELIATVENKIDKIIDERSRYDQTTGRGAAMHKKLTRDANTLQRDLVGYRKILAAKR